MSTISSGTTTNTAFVITPDTTGKLVWQTNGTTTGLTLDTSQNLGLGVTPSAWSSSDKAIQVGTNSCFYNQGSTYTMVSHNGYNSSGSDIYLTTNYATRYYQGGGTHYWSVAPSGTAGNAITFTQAMTLTNSGQLLVGTTSDVSQAGYFGALQAQGAYPALVLKGTESSAATWQIGESAGTLAFWRTTIGQAMTLFNSGGLSLGNTTDPGAGNFKPSGWVGYDSSDNFNTISNGVQLNGYIFSNLYSSYYGNGVSFSGSTSFAPTADNLISLGTSSKRWSVVYAATGSINTSDENAKTNIQDSTLGLSFINLLKPKTYLMKDSGNYTTGTVRNKVDANGTPILLSNGQPEQEIVPGSSISIAGKRTHLGLVAQDVKATLDSLNIDLALWVNTTEGQGLRYDEFIAPMIKAIQELSAELNALKAKVGA